MQFSLLPSQYREEKNKELERNIAQLNATYVKESSSGKLLLIPVCSAFAFMLLFMIGAPSISSFFLGIFGGGILGLIVMIIAMPITSLSRKQNKIAKEKLLKETTENDIAVYIQEFSNAVKQTTIQYDNAPCISGIISEFMRKFSAEVNNANRLASQREIAVTCYITTYKDGILMVNGLGDGASAEYKFSSYGYQNLADNIQNVALSLAVSRQLEPQLRSLYSHDVSGTQATINMIRTDNTLIVTYSALNGFYRG